MKKGSTLGLLLATASFGVAYAQGTDFGILRNMIQSFSSGIVGSLGVLFMGMAVVSFFYGIVVMILGRAHGDGEKAKTGGKFMLWGLLGLFVMFSIYGIIRFAQKATGVGGETNITKPCTDFINGCPTGGASPSSVPVSATPSRSGGSGAPGGSGTGVFGCTRVGDSCGGGAGKCVQSPEDGSFYCSYGGGGTVSTGGNQQGNCTQVGAPCNNGSGVCGQFDETGALYCSTN